MKDIHRNHKTGLYILLIILGILISTPSIILCVLSIAKGSDFEDLAKVDFFALVSVVVTIWAGLNIANYFDKKEYEDFKDKIEQDLEATNDRITESFKEQFDREVNSKIADLENVQEKLYNNLHEQFLNALLVTEKDAMSSFLYTLFSTRELMRLDIPYDNLICIENVFSQVYKLYYSEGSSNIGLRIGAKAEQGLAEIQKAENSDSDDLIKGYLLFRKAEFLYYSGRTNDNQTIGARLLNKAIENYLKSCRLLNIFIIECDGQGTDSTYAGDMVNKKYSAYFANTLGSLYYNLYKNSKNNDCLKMALFYCSCAVQWVEKKYEREVYYRNYGVAIESTKDNDYLHKAKEQYIKALNTADINQKLLHCLVSVSDKIINDILNITPVSPDEERKIKLCSHQYWDFLEKLSENDVDAAIRETEELRRYCMLASRVFPNDVDGYLYMAVCYRDLYLLEIAKTNQKNRSYLDSAQNEIQTAKMISPENRLMLVVERDINNLFKSLDKTYN